jgi:hypothetical protein
LRAAELRDVLTYDYSLTPWDIGIHARRPLAYAPDAAPMADRCDVLGGGVRCWYDGSSLAPSELFRKLQDADSAHAEELIWAELVEWYGSLELVPREDFCTA